MIKPLHCFYNLDSNSVEVTFSDGSVLTIDCEEVENHFDVTNGQVADLDWLLYNAPGKDMEMSCDEAVIRKMGSQIRADYSASLLRLATHKKIIAGMPLAFGEGDTKGRVMNMAKWKKPKLWVSLTCLLLCATILVACAVNPKTAGSSVGTNGTEITGKVTTSNDLNIREEPTASSAVVGNYDDGTIITILETKDGWGRTDLGWVSLNYITTMDGTPVVAH